MLNKFKSIIMAVVISVFSVSLVADPFTDTHSHVDIVELVQGGQSGESCHDDHKACDCEDYGDNHKHGDSSHAHKDGGGCEHCESGCDCDNCTCEDCKCSHCEEKKMLAKADFCDCSKSKCSHKDGAHKCGKSSHH